MANLADPHWILLQVGKNNGGKKKKKNMVANCKNVMAFVGEDQVAYLWIFILKLSQEFPINKSLDLLWRWYRWCLFELFVWRKVWIFFWSEHIGQWVKRRFVGDTYGERLRIIRDIQGTGGNARYWSMRLLVQVVQVTHTLYIYII